MNVLRQTFAAVAITMSASLPLVVSSTVMAKPATEQQATNNLVKQLSGITSLTANFEQTTQSNTPKAAQNKTLTAQHMNQTFSGVMKVERPGKFYWETTKPSKQTIVTSGKTVWIYDPDLQQVIRQNLDEQVSNTPALLLSGNASDIMKAYRVTQPNAKKTYYTLFPKDTEGAFQSLTISFGTNKAPNLMILQDSMGQTTQIKFKDVKVNPKLPAKTFEFDIPAGTDVIDQM